MRSILHSLSCFAAGALAAVALPVLGQTEWGGFPDVTGDAYFAPHVRELSRIGIIRGYDDGRFGPDDLVTRGQVATMLSRYDAASIEPLRAQLEEIRNRLGLGVCGDGERDTGEECDDGNLENGDGCSARCVPEVTCPGGRKLGERFAAEDGCNTCVCTQNGVACTLMACGGGERRCFGSEQCPEGMRCSTERGDCRSACEPGAEACIQVCAGVCEKAEGPTCGDGRCDEGEGSRCAPCKEQPCPMSPCTMGSCPEDCEWGQEEPVAACERPKAELGRLLREEASCDSDDDCALFEFSCPYVTCGDGIRADALDRALTAARSYADCRENAREPLPCAACAQMTVSCVEGRCIAGDMRTR